MQFKTKVTLVVGAVVFVVAFIVSSYALSVG